MWLSILFLAPLFYALYQTKFKGPDGSASRTAFVLGSGSYIVSMLVIYIMSSFFSDETSGKAAFFIFYLFRDFIVPLAFPLVFYTVLLSFEDIYKIRYASSFLFGVITFHLVVTGLVDPYPFTLWTGLFRPVLYTGFVFISGFYLKKLIENIDVSVKNIVLYTLGMLGVCLCFEAGHFLWYYAWPVWVYIIPFVPVFGLGVFTLYIETREAA